MKLYYAVWYSGIYDIDVEEHRKLIPSTVADLSEDGYIYQHSTNSYVRRDVENRSKFGQYQRGEYTPSPIHSISYGIHCSMVGAHGYERRATSADIQ
jgi:hypothetical protein